MHQSCYVSDQCTSQLHLLSTFDALFFSDWCCSEEEGLRESTLYSTYSRLLSLSCFYSFQSPMFHGFFFSLSTLVINFVSSTQTWWPELQECSANAEFWLHDVSITCIDLLVSPIKIFAQEHET